MGLITKTVKVKWQSRNKNHFVDLGYKFTKIGDEFEVKIEDLSKGSNIKVKCICDECGCELNREYCNYIKIIKDNEKIYCRSCGNKLIGSKNANKTKLKNSKSFEEWCIENDRQDILSRWDYELNNCKPNEITYRSKKKCWFKCDKHSWHKSELKNIGTFTKNNLYLQCNQCNSFAQWLLDNDLKIEDYWDYDKNTLSPWEISYSSDKKVWIKCQEKDYHESYEVKCKHFVKGSRCSYCSNRQIHPKDSLGQYIVDVYNEDILNKIWSDKNKKSAFEYAPYGHFKVWWKCLDGKHEDYYRGIDKSNKSKFRCPQCSQEREESLYEEQTRLYLESLGYIVLHEHNCTITLINPKTKHHMRYDNEVILDNGEHLIIEVNGEQHYNIPTGNWIGKDKTPEQQLHYQQVKDRYKRIYAIQNGYHYLEIPYTAFDKQETYKKLIDDKINEIKQIKNNQQEESA